MKITLRRSLIGRPKNQIETVKALGLKRIGDSRELPENGPTRGMVETVRHLLEVSQ